MHQGHPPGSKFVLAYFARGVAYADSGRFDKAIADYNEVVRMHPNYAPAYYGRGAAYANQGQYDKEIADCTKAIHLDRKYVAAYYGRGVAYGYKGEYDKEIADCTMAIRLDPKYSLAYYCRGWAYDKKGRYDEAIADYTEAIRLQPQYAERIAPGAGPIPRTASSQGRSGLRPRQATRLQGTSGKPGHGPPHLCFLVPAALIVGVVLLLVIGRWIAAPHGPAGGWPIGWRRRAG